MITIAVRHHPRELHEVNQCISFETPVSKATMTPPKSLSNLFARAIVIAFFLTLAVVAILRLAGLI